MPSATPEDFLQATSSEDGRHPKSSVGAYVEKSELTEIYNIIQQLKEETEQAKAENSELKNKVSSLEAQNSEIATLRDQVFELDKQNADLLYNQHLLDKQNTELKNKVSSLEAQDSEIATLRGQVFELISQLSEQKEQSSVDQQNASTEEVRHEVDAITETASSEAAAKSDDDSFDLVPSPGNAGSVESGSVGLAGESHWDAENSPSDVLS